MFLSLFDKLICVWLLYWFCDGLLLYYEGQQTIYVTISAKSVLCNKHVTFISRSRFCLESHETAQIYQHKVVCDQMSLLCSHLILSFYTVTAHFHTHVFNFSSSGCAASKTNLLLFVFSGEVGGNHDASKYCFGLNSSIYICFGNMGLWQTMGYSRMLVRPNLWFFWLQW